MIIFVIFLLHSIFSLSTNVSGNEIDKLALLAFKSQLTENPQNALTSWNDTLPVCQWEGITCGRRHQRVVILDLESKGLGGTISPHIGNLTFLREIRFFNNSFHGNIPQEVGLLFRLESLNLNYNSLEGDIPGNISYCLNLQRLSLATNFLVGKIPTELGSLSKLTNLVLSDNNLSGGIPLSLGNLTFLQILVLSNNNNLGGYIPSTLQQLRNLEVMFFDKCNLSGEFPPFVYSNLSTIEIISITENQLVGQFRSETFVNLPNLKEIYVGANKLSGYIPTSLFNASNLKKIDIFGNQFMGKVPENIGNLINLTFFVVGYNNLGSGKSGDMDLLTSLTNCSHLRSLSIGGNNFGGILPASIGNFSTLEALLLGENRIYGTIPPEIGEAKSLLLLYMSDNFFSGRIPMEMGNLHNLGELWMHRNHLSGKIPSSLSNMSKLFRLHLSENNLGGSIASTLNNKNLQRVNLSHNYFSGNLIEPDTRLSSRLILLDISYNFMIGSIPLEMGSLKNLNQLDISHNNLSGEIPPTLGTWSSMEILSLQSNSFHGSIPPSLSSIRGLRFFDLSSNNFTGIIPKELGTLPFLTYLNLSFNQLEGEVPVGGVFINTSAFFISGNNKTCGGVSQLKLPRCPVLKSKKQSNAFSLKVILGVSISLFLVVFFVAIYLWKKPKAKPSTEPLTVDLRRVSYIDLHKATDGFSAVNLIGTGSYGSVYKGTPLHDEGLVAVKVFKLMEAGASKSFLRECEALREIRHRNLLKIFTVCSSEDSNGNDFKALVFEFMPNGSLDNWLHPSSILPRCLNFLQRLNIAIDVASALNYLHNDLERPIVHCDVKASNILLDEDMIACVGDFGLAKFLFKRNNNSIDNESSTIAVRGTIGYIPPEYGMGAEVSKQGDMYSYGILLLEMITGKKPTDQMFKDGLSLREFCKVALPIRLLEIIDMGLSHEVIDDTSPTSLNPIKECFNAIIEIGIACSMEQVEERMNIKQALKELHSIKKVFLSLPSHKKTSHNESP